MKEMLETIAKYLVNNPDQVTVTEVEGEQSVILELRVAQEVGMGAVIFSALKNEKIKDVVFNIDEALDFEGETSCSDNQSENVCSSRASFGGYCRVGSCYTFAG